MSRSKILLPCAIHTKFPALAGLGLFKISDSIENWWVTLISWGWWLWAPTKSFSLELCTPTPVPPPLDDSFNMLSPQLKVRIPVKFAPGISGSRSNSDSSCVVVDFVFLKYPASTFGRWCEDFQDRCVFFRAPFALMPSRDQNAVMETIITATAASACCQNSSHTMSRTVVSMRKPEMRTMAMIIIRTLRHKKMPRKIFCWRLILTFQSKMTGIDWLCVRNSEFWEGWGVIDSEGLLSKSDVMSRTIRIMARARFFLNAVPCARSVCQVLWSKRELNWVWGELTYKPAGQIWDNRWKLHLRNKPKKRWWYQKWLSRPISISEAG